jgi:hypothetical protein
VPIKYLFRFSIIFLLIGNCSGENKAKNPSVNHDLIVKEEKPTAKNHNAERLCVGQDATVECLKDNFSFFYKNDYDAFWELLHKTYRQAAKDSVLKSMEDFLGIVPYIKENAEVEEYFSEKIEKWCIRQLPVFFNAALKLDDVTFNEVVLILRNPTFDENKEIESVFNTLKSEGKYKKIVEQYFKPAVTDTSLKK